MKLNLTSLLLCSLLLACGPSPEVAPEESARAKVVATKPSAPAKPEPIPVYAHIRFQTTLPRHIDSGGFDWSLKAISGVYFSGPLPMCGEQIAARLEEWMSASNKRLGGEDHKQLWLAKERLADRHKVLMHVESSLYDGFVEFRYEVEPDHSAADLLIMHCKPNREVVRPSREMAETLGLDALGGELKRMMQCIPGDSLGL